MYILIIEKAIGGGQSIYIEKKLYSLDNLDHLYQFLENKIEQDLKIELDDYWNSDINTEIFDYDNQFNIYSIVESKIEQKIVFESYDKTWSEFYSFCFPNKSVKKNENLVMKFSKFFESKEKFPNIKNLTIDGFEVLVGRDANSNDYLTTKMANPDDLWFHARGVPGSHIVLRVKDKLPTSDIIKKVAEISAKNSKMKEGEVNVVYCKAKFVTKKPDSKPGQVVVDAINSDEIKVRL